MSAAAAPLGRLSGPGISGARGGSDGGGEAREVEAVDRATDGAAGVIEDVGVDRAGADVVVSERVWDRVSDHPSAAADGIAARAQLFDRKRCGFGLDLL